MEFKLIQANNKVAMLMSSVNRPESSSGTSLDRNSPVVDFPSKKYGDYDESGVDLSLIRYVLQLSPLDRLKLMERRARETQVLNEYGRRHIETGVNSIR